MSKYKFLEKIDAAITAGVRDYGLHPTAIMLNSTGYCVFDFECQEQVSFLIKHEGGKKCEPKYRGISIFITDPLTDTIEPKFALGYPVTRFF